MVSIQSPAFRRLSRGLHALTLLCALAGVCFSVARWLLLGRGESGGLAQMLLPSQALQANIAAPLQIDVSWRLVGVAIECLPTAAMLFTVWCLHRICTAFLRGEVFGPAVVRGFRGVGWGFIAMFAASLVHGAAVTALLSWLASGQRGGQVALSVGSFEVSVLIVGLMMLLLAHVMAEGQRLQEESSAFV